MAPNKSKPVRGHIYIAGSFRRLPPYSQNPHIISSNQNLTIDNDPHIISSPLTWGICRPDFRKAIDLDQFDEWIFFVLPKKAVDFDGSPLPQTVFAYMRVAEKTSHQLAYGRFADKRMNGKHIVEGNILVDALGKYNYRFDFFRHQGREDTPYLIGDAELSGSLPAEKIRQFGPSFLQTLEKIFNKKGSIFSIITRKGRVIDNDQVRMLRQWLII